MVFLVVLLGRRIGLGIEGQSWFVMYATVGGLLFVVVEALRGSIIRPLSHN